MLCSVVRGKILTPPINRFNMGFSLFVLACFAVNTDYPFIFFMFCFCVVSSFPTCMMMSVVAE